MFCIGCFSVHPLGGGVGATQEEVAVFPTESTCLIVVFRHTKTSHRSIDLSKLGCTYRLPGFPIRFVFSSHLPPRDLPRLRTGANVPIVFRYRLATLRRLRPAQESQIQQNRSLHFTNNFERQNSCSPPLALRSGLYCPIEHFADPVQPLGLATHILIRKTYWLALKIYSNFVKLAGNIGRCISAGPIRSISLNLIKEKRDSRMVGKASSDAGDSSGWDSALSQGNLVLLASANCPDKCGLNPLPYPFTVTPLDSFSRV
ncbi:hypothetical protein KQX54_019213 [Cotesia glomerata]|uniref:Uncharacterized protein n=1 Tax=Cotesia glomerata TaxID=32391 RepID=A0AAV7IDG2_COTGL|nr:hypothetical protein KQX54_019213 [Cotesia glomerata]